MNKKDFNQQIKDGLIKIDQINVKVPELSYFTSLINEQEKLQKQNKQFVIFAICAVFIVALILLSIVLNAMIFMVLQAVSVMMTTLWFIYKLLFKRKAHI